MNQIVVKPEVGRIWWKATCPFKRRQHLSYGTGAKHEDDLGQWRLSHVAGYGFSSKMATKWAKRLAKWEQASQDRPVKRKRRQKAETIRIEHEL